MTRAEILEHIVADMRENLSHINVDPILEEHSLVGDLGLDSLELVELVVGVEQIGAFDVSDEEAEGWTCVGNVVDTVERFFLHER